jgi:hypothetical protein
MRFRNGVHGVVEGYHDGSMRALAGWVDGLYWVMGGAVVSVFDADLV